MMKTVLLLAVACYVISAVSAKPASTDDIQNIKNILQRLSEKREAAKGRPKPGHGSASQGADSTESDEKKLVCKNVDKIASSKGALDEVKELVQTTSELYKETLAAVESAQATDEAKEQKVAEMVMRLSDMEDDAYCAEKLLNKFGAQENPAAKCQAISTFSDKIFNREFTAQTDFCGIVTEMENGIEAPFYEDLKCLGKDLAQLAEDIKKENPTDEEAKLILVDVKSVGHDIHRMVVNLHAFHWARQYFGHICNYQKEAAAANAPAASSKRSQNAQLVAKLENILKELKKSQ